MTCSLRRRGTAGYSRFAATNIAEADTGNDDSANQPLPVLDRRLRKLFLNIALDQKYIFTSCFSA
jgi:hypothetical protein